MREKNTLIEIKPPSDIPQPLFISESLPAGPTQSTPRNAENPPLGPTVLLTRCFFKQQSFTSVLCREAKRRLVHWIR